MPNPLASLTPLASAICSSAAASVFKDFFKPEKRGGRAWLDPSSDITYFVPLPLPKMKKGRPAPAQSWVPRAEVYLMAAALWSQWLNKWTLPYGQQQNPISSKSFGAGFPDLLARTKQWHALLTPAVLAKIGIVASVVQVTMEQFGLHAIPQDEGAAGVAAGASSASLRSAAGRQK